MILHIIKTEINNLPTYHKSISNNAWNSDATKKFEHHVDVDVGWKASSNSKHQKESMWEDNNKSSAKSTWKQITC